MTIIPVISFLNVKQHQKTNQSSSTNPFVRLNSLQNRFNLSQDIVSFSGNNYSKEKITTKIDNHAIQRKGFGNDFTQQAKQEIFNAVSKKNAPYLDKLLSLAEKALCASDIISLLEYIDREDTNLQEFSQKISNFNNFKKYLTGKGFKKSILSEHINAISSKNIANLLKSDILLDEPKNNYNSIASCWQYATELFEHDINKENIVDEIKLNYKAKSFMTNSFVNAMLLSMIYEKNICNELFYNRGRYINSNYIPRLMSLNEEDLIILRKVASTGITDKENSAGDLTGYPISIDDKIGMLSYLATNRDIINSGYKGIDISKYIVSVNKNIPGGNVIVKFEELKIDLLDKVLRKIGIPDEIVDKYLQDFLFVYNEQKDIKNNRDKFWDINYVHLLNTAKDTLLQKIIVAVMSNKFNDLIYEEGDLAQINSNNKDAFEAVGISYDKWIEPKIKPLEKDFVDRTGNKVKKFTVKSWKRCPQESLFDGNYTTCCTGIDKNHGKSFLTFLTNTCTTTLEVRTDKNKVVGMSRLFLAKINGEVSLIVENIEVNNKISKHYLYNDETKYQFRELIFDYARKFAKHINNNKSLPIYFSGLNIKVKDIEKGLNASDKYENVELIGEWPDGIYINSFGDIYNSNAIVDDGDEFKLTLIDISKKIKPPVLSNKIKEASDSEYNYQDVMNFSS